MLLASLTALWLAVSPESQALDAAGLRAYKANDYPLAVRSYRDALQADATNALAHYNLARVLALLRKANQVCEYDAKQATILEHLRRAVELDPPRLQRLRKDGALESVRGTLGYQVLTGRKPGKSSDLRAILAAVRWYGPTPGGLGPESGIQFAAAGSYVHWARSLDADGKAATVHHSGAWKLVRTRVRLNTHDDKGVEHIYEGTLGKDGALDLGELGRFTDDPGDCTT